MVAMITSDNVILESFASTITHDDNRLDIKAKGLFDSRSSRAFFDVKVFNPYAKSCPRSIPDSYITSSSRS